MALRLRLCVLGLCVLFAECEITHAESPDTSRHSADQMLSRYFDAETTRIEAETANRLKNWKANRDKYRQQLLEMLGLHPLPKRTDLKPTVTGTIESEDFLVEKLHFQSLPGLYVTGNLYRPKNPTAPSPALLYVCGHGRVKKNGISYGNKTYYHHHGCWFAKNGYVCLVIDSLQLGEIEGIHHGTYRHNMWWWLSRGYTPAGIEAWNCVRALDYLQSRDDVDGERIGVTGRSGGGAYSWWVAAIDERIRCAVPVAGITDLRNHVVDGCVEGHCDCMYFVNTYRWDYSMLAALVAPRPLLISNTDSDRIFPLDGVYRTYNQVRSVYKQYDAADKVGLHITHGPHKDTQELRIHAFRWLNHHLKNDDSLLTIAAEKIFEPEQLKVFDKLPTDEKNTSIQETFIRRSSSPSLPHHKKDWIDEKAALRQQLQHQTFSGWPPSPAPHNLTRRFAADSDNVCLTAYDFTSQQHVPLRLFIAHRKEIKKADLIVLNVLNEAGWNDFLATYGKAFAKSLADYQLPDPDDESWEATQQMFRSFPWAMAYVAPRGVGPSAWSGDNRKQIQIRRRFYLLGQTLDGMRVYDVRRAAEALRLHERWKDVPLWMQGEGRMAGVTLYASLFSPNATRLDLHSLPASHDDGPFLLNVQRFMEVPQAVALKAERSKIVLYGADKEPFSYSQNVAKQLGWDPKQIQLRKELPE